MLALKFLHLLCFVYWLGGDLGTFYASRFVGQRALSPAQRATAARIMMGADLAPRVCMPLTLASGASLAIVSGALPLPGSAAVAVGLGTWALCLAWLVMAVVIHVAAERARVVRLVQLDFALRVTMVAVLATLAVGGGLGLLAMPAPWLALKLLCFAATVLCGLMIRVQMRPFGLAFARLQQHGPDAAGDAVIAGTLARARPYVLVIWGLLLVSAATGIHWLRP